MRKSYINPLILAIALGCAGKSIAQSDSAIPTQRVDRATIPNRFLSIGRLLLNPNDRRQPVPLFGYSGLDNRTIQTLVDEARAGRVRLAIVTARNGGENSEYVGRGIVNLTNAMQQIQNDMGYTSTNNENLLALTRPLRGIEAAEEFIGDSSLWFPPVQSSPNVNDSTE